MRLLMPSRPFFILESLWKKEELQDLEKFFELKVVCTVSFVYSSSTEIKTHPDTRSVISYFFTLGCLLSLQTEQSVVFSKNNFCRAIDFKGLHSDYQTGTGEWHIGGLVDISKP